MKLKHLASKTILILIVLILVFTIFSFNDNNKTLDLNSNYHAYFCPEDDCNLVLYELFSNAKSIDCAVYNITEQWILDLNARFILDDDQYKNLEKQDNIKTDSSSAYMHNKFCIIDKNLALIGSLNFTYDAINYQNNNFIITNNSYIVNNLQKQFNKYWEGDFDSINFKNNTYPKLCISPNNCLKYFIDEAKNSDKIKCMFFSFTENNFAKELINKNSQIIMEKSQNSKYSEYNFLKENNVEVIWDKNPKFMHNKFCIFDNTLITGSYNMSKNANINNNESIIIIKDSKIINQYENYFDKYYATWGLDV